MIQNYDGSWTPTPSDLDREPDRPVPLWHIAVAWPLLAVAAWVVVICLIVSWLT